MPLYKSSNYHNHKKPSAKAERKPRTGPKLETIVKIMIEEGSLVPESHPRVKLPKLLRRISHVKFNKKGVSVVYKQAVGITQEYTSSPKIKAYDHVPKGWLPLNYNAVERFSKQFDWSFDEGGYLRGRKEGDEFLPAIINLERKVVRGQCALNGQMCETGIPIICHECSVYKQKFPEKNKEHS